MSKKQLTCPSCGGCVETWLNPVPTVDIIIEIDGRIVLIERANEPLGWALPGGFVDYGEDLESAAIREAREETGLELEGLQPLGAYSDPARDPRQHTISYVYIARGRGTLAAGDDAAAARLFALDELPSPLCFDHARIIEDFRLLRIGAGGRRTVPLL